MRNVDAVNSNMTNSDSLCESDRVMNGGRYRVMVPKHNNCVFLFLHQLLRGATDSLIRSLHIQKDPTAYNYIKVGGQIKVLLTVNWHTNKWGGAEKEPGKYLCRKMIQSRTQLTDVCLHVSEANHINHKRKVGISGGIVLGLYRLCTSLMRRNKKNKHLTAINSLMSQNTRGPNR